MILGFHEYFDVKKTQPTYFREKIITPYKPEAAMLLDLSGQPLKAKLHTLRLDQYNRWKDGMSIQMVYRGPKYSIKDHFNKGIDGLGRCISTQRIEIIITDKAVHYIPDNTKEYSYFGVVRIDGSKILKRPEEVWRLALNDGFASPGDFFNYFRKGFDGKIIHFTDLRY